MLISDPALSFSLSRSISGRRAKRSRKVLASDKTPSLYNKGEGHDCALIDPENTAVKVEMRFVSSILRFSLAFGWECRTKRGPTLYNGSTCKCRSCHAAHASLSPNLQDDQLQIITKNLKLLRFQELPEHHQTYLIKRFKLSHEDKENLDHQTENTRTLRMEEIISRLQENEWQGTFAGTDFDMIRNATFANPAASNRIDCFLESFLRPLEDLLAERCYLSEITPKEALEKLHKEYLELLTKAKIQLEKDLENLQALESSYEKLALSQQELQTAIEGGSLEAKEKARDAYLESIHAYRSAFYTRFKEKGKGAPLFFSLRKTLQSDFPLGHLRALEGSGENFFEKFSFLQDELNGKESRKEPFENAREEVQKRLSEVKAQLEVASLPFSELHTQMKRSLNPQKPLPQTPTKPELKELFYSRMKTVTLLDQIFLEKDFGLIWEINASI